MHKARRRRDDIILRTLTYILMTIAVVFLALLCLFIVLGYSIDKKTGHAEQGGLIQFRSFPDNAAISLDGNPQSFNSPGKTTADATQHAVSMTKKDYRGWSKSFTLGRGELLWLNARLVPNSITTNEAIQFDSLAQAVASPDKKWIAVVEKANVPMLKIIDIRDEKNPKVVSLKIPAELLKATAPTDSFVVTEWDFGSRYVLVKHVSATGVEWLRLDRSDETNGQNLSSRFKLAFSELHFRGNSGENFYGLSAGELRKLTLSNTSPPALIAQNVTEFSLYGDSKIALVMLKNNQQLAAVYRDGDKSPTVFETIPKVEPAAHVALTSFFGDDYAAVSEGVEAKLVIQPFNSKPKTIAKLPLAQGVAWLFFSPNGQFLMAQNGLNVANYNLERDLATQFVIPGDGSYTRPTHLAWLDDFHLWSDVGGTLRMFEFDGTNPEVINNVVPGHDMTLSDNGKRLFSIGTNTTTKKPVLQSSVMVVE